MQYKKDTKKEKDNIDNLIIDLDFRYELRLIIPNKTKGKNDESILNEQLLAAGIINKDEAKRKALVVVIFLKGKSLFLSLELNRYRQINPNIEIQNIEYLPYMFLSLKSYFQIVPKIYCKE